jgi:ligand-binding sensor domain-containing protein/serine phosphatase RsbU (regulator of sigma subunit)
MRTCLVVIFAVNVHLVTGQVLSARLFSEDNGLQQNFIFSIDQDSNGVLILGTESGVVNYNGDYFSTAVPVSSLAEQQVAAVHCDRNGKVWVGHFQSGVSTINRNVCSIADSSSHVRGRISSFTEDGNGNVWGLADGRGLFRINLRTQKVNTVSGCRLSEGEPVYFHEQLLIGSESGLRIYDIGDDYSVSLRYILAETQNLRITSVCIARMYRREIVFASAEGLGIFYYEWSNGSFEFKGRLGHELIPADAFVTSLSGDQFNTLWVGTMGYGLFKFEFGPTCMAMSTEAFNESNGLVDNNIHSLLIDNENNVWLGTFGSGLVEIPYSVFRFYTTQNGLVKPEVNCIVKDRSNSMWIGTNSGVTHIGETGTVHYDASRYFLNATVTCLAVDSSGKIWIGTEQDGLFTHIPGTTSFLSISSWHKLQSESITGLVINRNGEVYAGTTDGLYVFLNDTDPPGYYTTLDGLAHNNIRQMCGDEAGNVWFASEGSPPYAMVDHKVKVVNDLSDAQSVAINSVCADNSGNHWVATDGDGLFSFTLRGNGRSCVGATYSVRNGLRSDHCIASGTDSEGLLWVVHRSGLSMKFPGDSLFYAFTASDNKLFDKMNPCIFRDDHERLYLCSELGLIEVQTESREYLRRPPQISIANLFINGIERTPLSLIELDPGSYNLTFEFNRILFSAATPGDFYYRILGADSTWRSVSGRSIAIPQLSAGEYELQVMSSRAGIVTDGIPYSVRISIDYPFWQKVWFIVLMILLVPLVIYGIIRRRMMSLLEMNQRLHVLVREKTFLLEAEKESVARINSELRQKSKDVTDSIKYAKRIQLAILTDLELLQRNFPDSFVFYQPRDIVSGDFYWFAERDGLFFVAIADCTGHGVPGAFMSMISSTLINKVVFDLGYTRPSIILQSLNNEIKSSLHQQESSESSHDGLDLALCVIDKNKNVLRFSGAGRPLLQVRNGEVIVHKTNKGGLGGVYSKIKPTFEEIRIDLQKGDCFYMYSDGFTDQFGGANQHKFSSPSLRGLLKLIHKLPMEEQDENIRKAFNAWKGSEEQCDDILIAGFRI